MPPPTRAQARARRARARPATTHRARWRALRAACARALRARAPSKSLATLAQEGADNDDHDRADTRMPLRRVSLEDLYVHHDPEIVVDAVPAVIAWVMKGLRRRRGPFVFEVAHEPEVGASPAQEILELTWDLALLRRRDAEVVERARRLEHGRTVQREHLTELAGYGLAMAAIAVLMPGQRVVHVRRGLPPDLLFDLTPGALRGVEVAARTRGGRGALTAARRAKESPLAARADVVEAHLSLWCGHPRVGIHAKVKP